MLGATADVARQWMETEENMSALEQRCFTKASAVAILQQQIVCHTSHGAALLSAHNLPYNCMRCAGIRCSKS